MRNPLTLAITILALACTAGLATAQTGAVDEKTKKQVLAEVERYVANDIRLKKLFLIVDPRTDQALRLTFDHVHTGVAKHAAGHAVCVDFKDADGTVYDVDIVVAKAPGKTEVREVFLHKVGGEPVGEKSKSGE